MFSCFPFEDELEPDFEQDNRVKGDAEEDNGEPESSMYSPPPQ